MLWSYPSKGLPCLVAARFLDKHAEVSKYNMSLIGARAPVGPNCAPSGSFVAPHVSDLRQGKQGPQIG
ncbi:hypothetical protein J1614_007380 [Plenodomus biglobosus]|nr:hypothetical protein J1614_007380 [Plenodomus biglobosus]